MILYLSLSVYVRIFLFKHFFSIITLIHSTSQMRPTVFDNHLEMPQNAAVPGVATAGHLQWYIERERKKILTVWTELCQLVWILTANMFYAEIQVSAFVGDLKERCLWHESLVCSALGGLQAHLVLGPKSREKGEPFEKKGYMRQNARVEVWHPLFLSSLSTWCTYLSLHFLFLFLVHLVFSCFK